MKQDKRKNNGGARAGAGNIPIAKEEKKIAVTFYVKRKHVIRAKETILPIIGKINSQL